MMTDEERLENEKNILCHLNYPKLMCASLEKIERYDLDAHCKALKKVLTAMSRCDDASTPGLRSMIAWHITNEAYEDTVSVLGRRALLRYEQILQENTKRSEILRSDAPLETRKTLVAELDKRYRLAYHEWQRTPTAVKVKLLNARKNELGEVSIVETYLLRRRLAAEAELARIIRYTRRKQQSLERLGIELQEERRIRRRERRAKRAEQQKVNKE